MTNVIIVVQRHGRYGKRVPQWLQTIFFGCVSRCLFVKAPAELKILQELQKNRVPTSPTNLANQYEWQQNVCAKCIVYKNMPITLWYHWVGQSLG